MIEFLYSIRYAFLGASVGEYVFYLWSKKSVDRHFLKCVVFVLIFVAIEVLGNL